MKKINFKGMKGCYQWNSSTQLYEGYIKNDPSQTFYGEDKQELEEDFRQLVYSLLDQE